MSKLLSGAAMAAILLSTSAAYADSYNRDSHTRNNAAPQAAIQKGQSAAVKGYGYNKQGDHYSASNAYRDQWNNSYGRDTMYPGSRQAFGAKEGVMIRKGGSAATDSSSNAATRQYGSYWQ